MSKKKEPIEIKISESGKNRHLIDNLLKTKSYYIGVLTPDYFNDEKCIKELIDAAQLNLKIYGLGISGTKLPKEVRKLPWKELKMFDNNIQITLYIQQLVNELSKK